MKVSRGANEKAQHAFKRAQFFLTPSIYGQEGFWCSPSGSQSVPQVPNLFPNIVPSIILLTIYLSLVLWIKLNFHCTPSSQCVPQHGPQVSYFFISCALAKVELSLYPKFPMCSPRCPKCPTSSIILLHALAKAELSLYPKFPMCS
jgi:hypothetical protein